MKHHYKIIVLTSIIILFFVTGLQSQSVNKHTHHNLGLAEVDSVNRFFSDIYVNHFAYSVSFNKYYKVANWVSYELADTQIVKKAERTNIFTADPKIEETMATHADYLKSGYDRGHLAPAGDMTFFEQAMIESFYYSNMAPQVPNFNRGIWKKLETQVRNWAIDNKKITVFTGPVLDTNLTTMGPNKIAIPQLFYKVIIDNTLPDIKGIAFLMPNQGSDLKLQEFAVSIDSIESITHINFLPALDSINERNIESTLCYGCWGLNMPLKTYHLNTVTIPPLKNKDKTFEDKKSVTKKTNQCNAITKAGTRCKRNALKNSKKCKQHQ